jgi:hypothetical protein
MEQAIRATPEEPVGLSEGEDVRLLRAFEPIVRYTKGELFMPMGVEPYLASCSLWRTAPREQVICIVPAGELTVARLCEESRTHQDAALSLRYVQEPLGRAAYRRWRRSPRDRLRATGRFTTTGMFGRLVEAGFRASLLLRGTVSAGLAAAAQIAYRRDGETDRFVYYGHVVRDGGYVCLQYWLFYAMNDWRSSFSGVNDHEADWELVTIYLAEHGATLRPAWVALSSHEGVGDDLRRRWDDPELRRAGDHPIVFAGAGSHSGAFIPGDYVISVDPPQLRKLIGFARRVQRLLAPWRDETRTAGGFGIPFVDYARGDGLSIGPQQDANWTPTVIDDSTPWVRAYRGLWGLDTKDPFGGERAPAGPRYERDGSVRKAWSNPLGWAGLLKVPPRPVEETAELLRLRVDSIERELPELDAMIAAERTALRSLQAQVRSLGVHDYARSLAARRRAELIEREATLNEHIAARTRLADERHSYVDSLQQPAAELPQAHLRAPHGPRTEEQERRVRFLRLWAVISTPLLLAAPIVVLVASPLTWIPTIAALAGLFLAVEAIARHRFVSFLGSVLLVIGIIAALGALFYLLRNHWTIVLSVIFGAAALAVLIGNLGDLRHGWLRGPHGHEADE